MGRSALPRGQTAQKQGLRGGDNEDAGEVGARREEDLRIGEHGGGRWHITAPGQDRGWMEGRDLQGRGGGGEGGGPEERSGKLLP